MYQVQECFSNNSKIDVTLHNTVWIILNHIHNRNYWNLDECVTFECSVFGETCHEGECSCGSGPTCHRNQTAPICDAENGQCVAPSKK